VKGVKRRWEGSRGTSGRVNELPNAHAAVIIASLFAVIYCLERLGKVVELRGTFSTWVITPDSFSEVVVGGGEPEHADVDGPRVGSNIVGDLP
jgi:hypothetical protein